MKVTIMTRLLAKWDMEIESRHNGSNYLTIKGRKERQALLNSSIIDNLCSFF
jgi:hypothetical protein